MLLIPLAGDLNIDYVSPVKTISVEEALRVLPEKLSSPMVTVSTLQSFQNKIQCQKQHRLETGA